MAFVATQVGRNYSIGPTKQALFTITAVSGDTTGTLTAPGLSRVDSIQIGGGLRLSAAPTFSGNVVTLAFADPSTAGYFGTATVHGV